MSTSITDAFQELIAAGVSFQIDVPEDTAGTHKLYLGGSEGSSSWHVDWKEDWPVFKLRKDLDKAVVKLGRWKFYSEYNYASEMIEMGPGERLPKDMCRELRSMKRV